MIREIYRRWLLKRLRSQGLKIADDCRLIASPSCFGSEPYLIAIGRHVTISAEVTFLTHDGGTWVFRGNPESSNVIKYGRITIHDNCFIGFGTTILPGVSIGPNAITAAGSVVTKDVLAGQVWGGVPAKYICSVEEYAQKSMRDNPAYNRESYRKDKKSELLRLFPYPW
jgi:acetyltransferase-like isoleucine patch superfamily enzyme